MNQRMFAVYDSKAKTYCVPFFVPAVVIALRAFQGEANNPASQLSAYPQDFTLFELGEFNDSTGVVVAYALAINHGLAANFIKEPSHVRQIAPESVGNETLVLPSPQGGYT